MKKAFLLGVLLLFISILSEPSHTRLDNDIGKADVSKKYNQQDQVSFMEADVIKYVNVANADHFVSDVAVYSTAYGRCEVDVGDVSLTITEEESRGPPIYTIKEVG